MGHCIRNILMFVFTSLLRHQLVVKKNNIIWKYKIRTETTKAPKSISMDFLAPEGAPSYILKIPPKTPCTVLRSTNTTFSKNEPIT